MRRALPLWVVVAVLVAVAVWPLPIAGTQWLLSHPDQEAVQHVWGLWAATQSLDPIAVTTDRIAWPVGFDFVLIDPGNLPWFLPGMIFGPALGYNATLLVGVLAMGLAGALLTRAAGGEAGELAVGAAAAMVCPAFLSAASEGITESFAVGWAGVALGALLLHLEAERTRRWGVLAGLALGWAVWSGPYNGLWAALLLGTVGVVRIRAWRQTLPVGLLGLVIASPVIYGMAFLRRDGLPGTASRAEWEPPIGDTEAYRGAFKLGADLTDPFLPGWLTGGLTEAGHTAYLGLLVIGLAVLAVVRDRRRWPWLVGALAFVAASLGPWLIIAGSPIGSAEDGFLVAPVGVVAKWFPPLLRVTRWYRAAAIAGLLLAPLVALALSGRWRWLTLGILALESVVFAPRAWPMLSFDASADPVWAQLHRPGAVAELPAVQWSFTPEGAVRDENLLQQVWHGRPNSGTFFNLSGGAADSRELRALSDLARGKAADVQQIERLAGLGYAYVVIDRRRFERLDMGRLRGALGDPVAASPRYVVFGLPEGVPEVSPTFRPFRSPLPPPGPRGSDGPLQEGPGGHRQHGGR